MKNTNTTKTTGKVKRTATAMLAAAMMMTTAATIAASADNTDTNDLSSISVSRRVEMSPLAKRLREQKINEHERIAGIEKTVTIRNNGFYHAKNIKFYGRRIIGVDDNAEYIYGNWEQINETESLHAGGAVACKIEGHYGEYAFSYDITWGTDFPYSGVFWRNENDTNGCDIDITLSGICRMANVDISVGRQNVVNESNCSAHSEWKP